VREHIIWKSEPIWRARLKYAQEEISSSDGSNGSSPDTIKSSDSGIFYRGLNRVMKEMIEYKVPIEVVDSFITEEL
jgi:hypothetical protein